jgi:hypothetical protein
MRAARPALGPSFAHESSYALRPVFCIRFLAVMYRVMCLANQVSVTILHR